MNYDKEKSTITISKNTGITVSAMMLIMIGGALVTATINYNDLRNSTKLNTSDIRKLQEENDKLEADNVTSKVEFSKIQTQLKSIDTSLVEIKSRLQ